MNPCPHKTTETWGDPQLGEFNAECLDCNTFWEWDSADHSVPAHVIRAWRKHGL